MPQPIDLTDAHIGHLTVLCRAGSRAGSIVWNCRCDCGRLCTRNSYRLNLAAKTGLGLVCSRQCPLLHPHTAPTTAPTTARPPRRASGAHVKLDSREKPVEIGKAAPPQSVVKLKSDRAPVDRTLIHLRWRSHLSPAEHEELRDETGYEAFYPEIGQWLPFSTLELARHPNHIDWEYQKA